MGEQVNSALFAPLFAALCLLDARYPARWGLVAVNAVANRSVILFFYVRDQRWGDGGNRPDYCLTIDELEYLGGSRCRVFRQASSGQLDVYANQPRRWRHRHIG
jgi:hypothetical protein